MRKSTLVLLMCMGVLIGLGIGYGITWVLYLAGVIPK